MNCSELQEHAREDCFLVKKPRALQWYYKGELQKEKEEERQAGRFELFLDLLCKKTKSPSLFWVN
jgi:hypothetical protein